MFGVFALLGILLWTLADSPRSAILFLAMADGFAALPTIIKAWKNPETETGITYIASFISIILILPSIPEWNIENSAFQVYLLIANTLLIIAVYRKHIISKLGFLSAIDK